METLRVCLKIFTGIFSKSHIQTRTGQHVHVLSRGDTLQACLPCSIHQPTSLALFHHEFGNGDLDAQIASNFKFNPLALSIGAISNHHNSSCDSYTCFFRTDLEAILVAISLAPCDFKSLKRFQIAKAISWRFQIAAIPIVRFGSELRSPWLGD